MNMQPLRLFDSNLKFIAFITEYDSLNFTRSHRGIGEFNLQMEFGSLYSNLIKKDMFIEVDGRSDVIGIVTYIGYDENNEGKGVLIFKGSEAKEILSRRLIYPTAGYSYNVENAAASVVMQNYVDESVGSGAGLSRRISLITIDSVTAGMTIRRQARYKVLAEELEEIATVDTSGWRLFRRENNLVFKYVKGVNRVSSQSANSRVMFSTQFDNLEETNYVEDYSAFKNVAVVAGEGEGALRKIIEENPSAATGIDRREYFIDARDIQTENVPSGEVDAVLRQRARDKLAEVRPIQTFENGIISGDFGAFRYLRDWDLGDFVTVVNTKVGLTADAQITVVHENYSDEGFKVDVEIGEPEKGVKKVVELRTSRLDGELYR